MIILCMYVRSLPAAAKASQPPNPIVTRKDASRPPHKDGALTVSCVPYVQYSTAQYSAVLRGREGSRRSWTYIGRSLMVTWRGQ